MHVENKAHGWNNEPFEGRYYIINGAKDCLTDGRRCLLSLSTSIVAG